MEVTTHNTAGSFTAQWITNGGAAIAVDDDPNVTPPAADRIVRMPAHMFACDLHDGAGAARPPRVVCCTADGTSAAVRVWWYDDALLIWVPLAAGQTMTTAGANLVQINAYIMPGA